jgi:DNA-binding transcriptional MocR family regulator
VKGLRSAADHITVHPQSHVETAGGSLASAAPKIELPAGEAALHERLAQAIVGMIDDGRYPPGEQLPTHRELARQTGVAIGTVTKAIELLSKRGVVRGEVGRGTFINRRPDRSAGGTIDLTLNVPPLVIEDQLFLEASERAGRKVLTLPSAGLHDLTGTLEQRGTVADWLARTRLESGPEAMLLCVGAQQAIHLAFADIQRISPTIGSGAATFSGAIAAAAHLGLGWAVVDHDEEGMTPEALDHLFASSSCRAVYATPVCQNPLGFEVGEERRRAIVRICEKHDAHIIEDDIYGVYAAKGRLTYKELAPERVYYLTSLSKCLTPLVRLGVLVPPGDRIPKLTRDLRAHVFGAPPTALELGCALIELGADAIAADRLRREAKIRTHLAAELLRLDHVLMPEGTPHIWLPMPAVAAEKLARRATERGVRLTPPDASSIGGEKSGGVRLCILAPPDRNDLERALRIIDHLLGNADEMIV